MMYWDDTHDDEYRVTDEVIDLSFGIRCRSLPVDHAHALAEALSRVLPWLVEEELAGVHPIHVADSGNGWMRPEHPDDLLHLSRRTRLVLRVPRHRIDDARRLVGATLDVAGNPMAIEKVSERPLSTITTLFSRYVATSEAESEQVFMSRMFEDLGVLGVRAKKMLAGKEHALGLPDGALKTRGLMLAGLSVEDSVKLQQHGLGTHRHLGCGVFVPHKDIVEVGREQG